MTPLPKVGLHSTHGTILLIILTPVASVASIQFGCIIYYLPQYGSLEENDAQYFEDDAVRCLQAMGKADSAKCENDTHCGQPK